MNKKNKEELKSIVKLLKLDRPLVIFDLETTGLSLTSDRIIEIAYLKISPDGKTKEKDMFLNPEIKISDESSQIHGLTNKDVDNKPAFKERAQEIWDDFDNCFYSGFNVSGFDLPLLKREFLRVGNDFEYATGDIIDAKTIYHYMEPRTLSAAYNFYCNKKHDDAHNALADVEVTAEILLKQLEKYNEIQDQNFLAEIHNPSDGRYVDNDRKFYWRDGEAYFSFSKYKDEALAKIVESNPEFLRWILGANFSEETKNIVSKALCGEFPCKIK